MEQENHMVIPGPDHPAYAEEREDDGHREDRLYDRWVDEQDDMDSMNDAIS